MKGLYSSVVRPPGSLHSILVPGPTLWFPEHTLLLFLGDFLEFSPEDLEGDLRGESHLVEREGILEPGPVLHGYTSPGQPCILAFQVLKVLTAAAIYSIFFIIFKNFNFFIGL